MLTRPVNQTARDLSNNYRVALITALSLLTQFHKNKEFNSMKQQDITSFLNSEPDESDPMHKWIGTYNHYLTILISFFKWLYYPTDAINDRPKPSVIKNIGMLTRREVETYNHTDL